MSPPTNSCPGCGEWFADIEGPVHAYVPSSPGCWRTFGAVQADEMQRFGYPDAHRIVVDAYMAQHPGDGGDRRDRQSMFVHLIGLCAVLERGLPHPHATSLLSRAVQRYDDFPVLNRANAPGELTVLDMVGARDLTDYAERGRAWAAAVWDSWSQEHEVIREALASAG